MIITEHKLVTCSCGSCLKCSALAGLNESKYNYKLVQDCYYSMKEGNGMRDGSWENTRKKSLEFLLKQLKQDIYWFNEQCLEPYINVESENSVDRWQGAIVNPYTESNRIFRVWANCNNPTEKRVEVRPSYRSYDSNYVWGLSSIKEAIAIGVNYLRTGLINREAVLEFKFDAATTQYKLSMLV